MQADNEMWSYKGDRERTLQHSLDDTDRRNGSGNEGEKEVDATLWVRKMLIARARAERGEGLYHHPSRVRKCDVGRGSLRFTKRANASDVSVNVCPGESRGVVYVFTPLLSATRTGYVREDLNFFYVRD